MGIPPRIQKHFDDMIHARNHIELVKAYGESASEIIRTQNSGSLNDQTAHQIFQAHNAIYTRKAQEFPCAPKTTQECVQLESLLLSPHPRFTRGWLEWTLSGNYNKGPTLKHRMAVKPIIERWIKCEYIRPAGNGDYTLGEEGRRLESAIKMGGRFRNVEDVYKFTSMDDLR